MGDARRIAQTAEGAEGAEGKEAKPRKVYRERVLVRVYDLGQAMLTRVHNQLTKEYGAFHTGVEVYGNLLFKQNKRFFSFFALFPLIFSSVFNKEPKTPKTTRSNQRPMFLPEARNGASG